MKIFTAALALMLVISNDSIAQIKPIDRNAPLPYYDLAIKYFGVIAPTDSTPMIIQGRIPIPYLKADLLDISHITDTLGDSYVQGKIEAQRKDFRDKIPDFGSPISPQLAIGYIQLFTGDIETYIPYAESPEIVGEIIYSALFCLDLQQRTGIDYMEEFDQYIGILQLSRERLLLAQGRNRDRIHQLRDAIDFGGVWLQFMLRSHPWTGPNANELNGFYQYGVRKAYLMPIEKPGAFAREHQNLNHTHQSAANHAVSVENNRNAAFNRLLAEQYKIASVLDLLDKTVIALQTWPRR